MWHMRNVINEKMIVMIYVDMLDIAALQRNLGKYSQRGVVVTRSQPERSGVVKLRVEGD